MRDRLVRFQVVYVPVRQGERLTPGVAADDDILVIRQIFRNLVISDPKTSEILPAFGEFRVDGQGGLDRIGGADYPAGARSRLVFGRLSANDGFTAGREGEVFGPASGRQRLGAAERLKTGPFFKKRLEQACQFFRFVLFGFLRLAVLLRHGGGRGLLLRLSTVGQTGINGGGLIDASFRAGALLVFCLLADDPLLIRFGAEIFHRLRTGGRLHHPMGRGSRRDLVPPESEIAERVGHLFLPVPRKDITVVFLLLFRLWSVFGERIVRSGDISL